MICHIVIENLMEQILYYICRTSPQSGMSLVQMNNILGVIQ